MKRECLEVRRQAYMLALTALCGVGRHEVNGFDTFDWH